MAKQYRNDFVFKQCKRHLFTHAHTHTKTNNKREGKTEQITPKAHTNTHAQIMRQNSEIYYLPLGVGATFIVRTKKTLVT